MSGEEDNDPSDNEIENYSTLKEDDVKRIMEQLKDFTAEKIPTMHAKWNCKL